MKKNFKKTAAAAAALVLACGCAVAGMCHSPAVSFAETSNAKYTGLVEQKNQLAIFAGGSEWYSVMTSVKSDDKPDTFVVPAYYRYSEPIDPFDKNRELAKNILALGYKSVDLTGSRHVIVSDGIYEIQSIAFNNTDDLKTVTLSDTVEVIEDLELDKDTVFRGHRGAYAERYAVNSGYTYEFIGDINGDGNINSADILVMSQYFNGVCELDEDEAARADENFDTKISIADYIFLKNEITEPRASAFGASFDGALAAPDLKNIKRINENKDTDGYMKFASVSAGKVLAETEDEKGAENPVYSPLSYYMALSMAAECSSGNTRDEIVNVLGSEDIEAVRKENDSLYRTINFDDFSAYCVLSNSLWLNNKWEFEQDTLDLIAKDYYAVSFAKDFADEKTPGEISEWIFKNTSEKIKPEIKLKPDSEIVKILNTITFKETWKDSFNNTEKDVFHKADGSDETCEFMKTFDTGEVGFADKFMVYAKDLNEGYKMYFVLPDEGVKVKDIVSDSTVMADIYAHKLDYKDCNIQLSVPEFEIASKFDLIEATKQMGVIDAFDDTKADFNAIVDYSKNGIKKAAITAIDHETKLKVDEKGCEGVAYTLITIATTAPAPPDRNVNFKLDRPFFYYIADRNDIPVFAGIIDNPNEEQE